jgi:hypothetical protein
MLTNFITYWLTPKGLNVRTANKLVLVSVTWAHTIFGYLKLFVNMRLALSFAGKKNRIFWTYESKVMGVWSFKEKSGQGGHVLEPTNKSWPLAQKVEGRKKKHFKKNGNCPKGSGVDPRPAGDRWSPAAGRHLRLRDSSNFFLNFLFKKKEFLEVWVMG